MRRYVDFLTCFSSDGQRDLQRELSITISKVEDGLARMFMGREQAKLTSNSEESDTENFQKYIQNGVDLVFIVLFENLCFYGINC